MRRLYRLPLALLLIGTVSCGSSGVDITAIPELPEVTPDEMTVRLAESTRPVVVNIWASWCIPCRSEAPLLERAADEFGDRVEFIAVNVRDSQHGARAFIAEFASATGSISYVLDGPGDVPIALGGGRGVPLTFFYGSGGEYVSLHHGVIDERTLALWIDEILVRGT